VSKSKFKQNRKAIMPEASNAKGAIARRFIRLPGIRKFGYISVYFLLGVSYLVGFQ
jgi:hypothetical protein